jgi:hypothetical protein
MHFTLRTNTPALGLFIALMAVFCLITRDAALAANVSWINPNSGTWSNASNWSGGVVPNNGAQSYFVSIANAVGQYTYVTQDLPSVTVSQLTLTMQSQINVPVGNTLQLADPSPGVQAVSGGVLSVAGTLRIATDGATLSLAQTSLVGGSILGNGIVENVRWSYGSGVIGNNGSNGIHDLRLRNVGNNTLPVWMTATSHAEPLLIGPSASATLANPGINNQRGVLQAEDGTLILRGPSIIDNSNTGVIQAVGTGVVQLINGIDIQGSSSSGTPGFTGTGKIQIPFGESATIRRSTSAVAHFETLGTLTLDEGFTNESGSLFSFGGTVSRLPGGTNYTFANKGTLRGLNETTAVLDLGDWSLGNATSGIIEGAGTIKTRQLFNARGVIRSNVSGQTLTLLSGTSIAAWSLLATNQSTMMIGTPTPTPNYYGGLSGGGPITIDAGSSMLVNNPSQFTGSITNNGSLAFNSAIATSSPIYSITGSGTLRFAGSGNRLVTTLRQYKIDLDNVTLSDSNGTGVWRTADLALAGTAKLSLRDSPYILDHGAGSPIAITQAWMAEGRFVSGITGEVVGYVESSDIGSPTTFMGEPNIDPTTLLFRSTFAGDTNLDRIVDFADLLALAQHYGSAAAYWNDGDFDHDRLVGFSDLLLLAQHYSGTAASGLRSPLMAEWSLARSLVPEPCLPVCLATLVTIYARARPRFSN